MPNDSIATLTQVSLRYGAVTALDGVDLAIPAGCMVGFIGPDGVGKSSLLGVISGVRALQAGQVEVFGGQMAESRHRQQSLPRIAYMPQGLGRNLYPTLSVAENVDFFGRLFDLNRRERAQRIAELLEATGLSAFADRPAAKLSGGMKQKLGLCCALVHEPDLLILDEPTTGVDPLSRRQFWELVERIRARHPGMSVLVATAYMEEAERFDWLVAMDGGRILGTGSAAELKAAAAANSLEEAFIRLLPEEKRRGHRQLVIPPRGPDKGDWAIEAENLSQRFGDFTAVDGVSFTIGRGEIFGFLGSNGCGKTTTMKMLTGLLPPSSGQARLFGTLVNPQDIETRRQVGYMSQAFSLYGELTVRQNLDLHARLFHLPEALRTSRVPALMERFGLTPYRDAAAADLPLGIRQRLSLAVAVVHEPRLLILDEPTSGVDPVARDEFWSLLVELSRNQGVTIFISTHFMNEAQRCDRISLMHAGRVLASDTPEALRRAEGCTTLEEAFIACLERAEETQAKAQALSPLQGGSGRRDGVTEDPQHPAEVRLSPIPSPSLPLKGRESVHFSLRRLIGVAFRETLELRRDPVRLSFALLGALLLMVVLGYGISMDVEGLRFAVLDRDRTPESRDYIANMAGSRYFLQQAPLASPADMDARMKSGEISVALEIPAGYGADLRRGRSPEIGAWIDGALPYRGEISRGYVTGIHQHYMTALIRQATGREPRLMPVDLALRYRYNQDVRSVYAMAPAVIALLLVLIPSILMALGVVREKELGSITNLYVTPLSRLEFLMGKQLPYIALSMAAFFLMTAEAVWLFGVPLKGSLTAFSLAALLYVTATTGLGLFISSFTRTQIAALFGTAILTMLPTVQFSGLTTPVESLEGAAWWIGQCFPASWFLVVSRGVFTKSLGFADLLPQLLALATFVPVLTLLSLVLLPKQES